MKSRPYFFYAGLAAFCALVLDISGLQQFSQSLRHRAQAISQTGVERTNSRAQADRHSLRANLAICSGWFLAIASVVLVIISKNRSEPAPRIAVLGLLVCHFLLQFVLV